LQSALFLPRSRPVCWQTAVMSPRSFLLSEDLARYVQAHSAPPDDVLRRLIERTEALGPVAGMQIAPEQGAFLEMLTRLMGATTVLEVGTFTGYSTLCFARGLAPGGRVIACDVSEEWTTIARGAWQEAGVDDRIELHIGPAATTLAALPTELEIDLAFIDADKGGYLGYYQRIVERLRPGGLIVADNVLWSGQVIDPTVTDEDTEALRVFNDAVATDPRVEVVLLPVADGLLLARRRP
jgi:caffeoyl-CoA O-methyltransferase